MKKIKIPCLLPILFGIITTGLCLLLDMIGGKNENETYFNIYPDSLITHMPDFGLISPPTFSYLPYSESNIVGFGGLNVFMTKSEKPSKKLKNKNLVNKVENIKLEDIFSVQVDYMNAEYVQKDYSISTKYPFPKIINKDNFQDFEILYYDFGKGYYMKKNELGDNLKLTDEWKHGYSRGIAENNENEYVFWILIW